MLPAHWPLILDAGTVLESCSTADLWGFCVTAVVSLHSCVAAWVVSLHREVGCVGNTQGCCTTTTMALTSIKQKVCQLWRRTFLSQITLQNQILVLQLLSWLHLEHLLSMNIYCALMFDRAILCNRINECLHICGNTSITGTDMVIMGSCHKSHNDPRSLSLPLEQMNLWTQEWTLVTHAHSKFSARKLRNLCLCWDFDSPDSLMHIEIPNPWTH